MTTISEDLLNLPNADLQRMLSGLKSELSKRESENLLSRYRPHQKQVEHHNAGKDFRERLLMAGNQTGKSYAVSMELAAHLTGLYWPWWQGKVFDRAIRAWACGETGEVIRETLQLLLLGRPGEYGTGCIPKASLLDVTPARGIADLVDTIRVQHVSGDVSTLAFKFYSQGRERFQGSTIDYCLLDEEPPFEIFSEALTRTNITRGPVVLSFTPLKGISTVVKRFLFEKSPDRCVTKMTLSDATMYSDEDRERIIAQYPEHERQTRTAGVPAMGEGRVFLTDEQKLLVDPFPCPSHWIRLGGCDFGWSHNASFCECWWDRDLDVFYLVRSIRMQHKTPLQHADIVRPWRLKWAWPADGRNQTLAGAGIPLMEQYRDAGLDMMHTHAQFEDGSRSVEAGVIEMADRMRGGRWKVFRGQNDGWLEEYSCYHRKDGLLVREGDDSLDASRYALVMKRFGQTDKGRAQFNRVIEYPSMGIA